MTSNQVTNLFGTQNANWMSSVQPATKTESIDFQSFMKNSEENLKSVENKATEVKKNTPVENAAEETSKNEGVKAGNETVQKERPVKEERKPAEDEVEAVKETVEAIRDAVKEALGITDEQLEEALEKLGLNVMALLIPENITAIAVEATGEESTISLVTNENLYETVKELTADVEKMTTELFRKLNIDPEEFNQAIADSQTAATEEVAETITEQFTEIRKESPVTVKNDSEKNLETKVSFENETPETKELKNFSVQTKNEDSKEETLASEESKNFKEIKSDDKTEEAPVSFIQSLVDKTQEALNATNETAVYTTEETKQLMDQITENIKVQVSLDTTEISIKLHPESLGNVNVKVSANSEGTMTAQFTAENENVKAVLEAQAVVLKEALEAKGITVEAIEVMVGSHEFNEDLSNRQERGNGSENKKSSTRRISLEDLAEQEELTEEENLQKEIMQQNGNTIDYTA